MPGKLYIYKMTRGVFKFLPQHRFKINVFNNNHTVLLLLTTKTFAGFRKNISLVRGALSARLPSRGKRKYCIAYQEKNSLAEFSRMPNYIVSILQSPDLISVQSKAPQA